MSLASLTITVAAVLLAACGGAEVDASADRDDSQHIGTILYASDRDNRPPENEELFGAINRLDLYRTEVPGGSTMRLSDDLEPDLGPECSPGGARIAVGRGRENRADLFVLDARGAHARAPFVAGPNRISASWAPDGRRVAFTRFVGAEGREQYDVYVGDVDSGRERLVVGGRTRDRSPAWSPGGDEIAFLRATDQYGIENDLYVVAVSGGHPRRVFRNVQSARPAWSPTGRELAIVRNVDGSTSVWIVELERGRARKLTKRSLENPQDSPAWSPDGRWIAFTETAGIALVHPDGTGYLRLELPVQFPGVVGWILYTTPSWCD